MYFPLHKTNILSKKLHLLLNLAKILTKAYVQISAHLKFKTEGLFEKECLRITLSEHCPPTAIKLLCLKIA